MDNKDDKILSREEHAGQDVIDTSKESKQKEEEEEGFTSRTDPSL
jgi:hypothetical protein